METKLICIKNIPVIGINNLIIGEIYTGYLDPIGYDVYKNEPCWAVLHSHPIIRYKYYQIYPKDYFMALSEFREIQINEILKDIING